jgi:D-3-phosphoglycerate dehydrogenase
MYDILKLDKISAAADKVFDDKYNFTASSDKPAGIMVRSFNMHGYNLNKELLAIARAGAGVNNIPVDECTKKGIVVFNTPGANANAVKELVLCALLIGSRKIFRAIEWTKTLKGKGEEVKTLVEKGKKEFVGAEIRGKKLGVIGLGAIGALVANAAAALDMDVLGYDPYITVDSAWGLSRNVKRITDINELLSQSDYISLNIPYNDKTKYFINGDAIAKMKKGVILINCSRGELVDNAELLKAVASGKIGKYITDFPADELLGVDNIICIPHLGASTPEAEDNCAIAAAQELVDYIENGNIHNSVNFPLCTMQRSGTCRIAIIHLNIKDMISKITSVLGKNNHNISNFVNKSQGDYAYSLLDIDDMVDKETVSLLEKIEGVIRVRLI